MAIQLEPHESVPSEGVLTEMLRPSVLLKRCIGCGICEFKCPMEGDAAIRVVHADAYPGHEAGNRRTHGDGSDGSSQRGEVHRLQF